MWEHFNESPNPNACKYGMQSCIQAYSKYFHIYFLFHSPDLDPPVLSDCISTFFLIIHVMHFCAVLCSLPFRRVHLLISLKRRENSRFLSTAQQPSSPLGNDSAASLLVRAPLCHANCFVFWHSRSSQASFPSKRQLRKRKKRSFLSISKLSFWNSLSPCWKGKCYVLVDLWRQGQRVGFSIRGLFVCVGWTVSSCNNGLSGYSGKLNWQNWMVTILHASQGYWSLYVSDNRCTCECSFVQSTEQCWSFGRIIGHFYCGGVLSACFFHATFWSCFKRQNMVEIKLRSSFFLKFGGSHLICKLPVRLSTQNNILLLKKATSHGSC